MKIKTAEHKIIHILENNNLENAIIEIRELFEKISVIDSLNSIERNRNREYIESDFEEILQKYKLNEIAINIFWILENVFRDNRKIWYIEK